MCSMCTNGAKEKTRAVKELTKCDGLCVNSHKSWIGYGTEYSHQCCFFFIQKCAHSLTLNLCIFNDDSLHLNLLFILSFGIFDFVFCCNFRWMQHSFEWCDIFFIRFFASWVKAWNSMWAIKWSQTERANGCTVIYRVQQSSSLILCKK